VKKRGKRNYHSLKLIFRGGRKGKKKEEGFSGAGSRGLQRKKL